MGRPKKNKMVTDGKDWNAGPKPEQNGVTVRQIHTSAKKLDEILRFNNSPYRTYDAEIYKLELKSMSRVELQDECARVGIKGIQADEVLRTRLLDKFQGYLSTVKASETRTPTQPKETPAIKKLLGDVFSRR